MKHWSEAVINHNCTVREAIQTIDNAALRLGLVVCDEGKLVGSLTDGDVRRFLLQKRSLDSSVTEAMNRNPITANRNWSEKDYQAAFEEYEILHIPLVDENGKLTSLKGKDPRLSRTLFDNPVFIMAGGFGSRLRPFTNNCPKPMLKIGGKPILEHILNHFINSGFHKFYISTHYLAHMITEYFGNGASLGVSIEYIHEETPLGTGGALGLLPPLETELPFFVINGDLLTDLDLHAFLNFHCNTNGIATMGVRKYEHQIPFGVVSYEGDRILSMLEKPTKQWFVNAGIYLLSPELLDKVSPRTPLDLPTLLEQQISLGKIVNIYPIHEYWLDVGRKDDFHRAKLKFGG